MQREDILKPKILYIGANNKKTLILVGMSNGFRIFDFKSLEEVRCKIFTGGIGKIDCLETSNFLCFTGGGRDYSDSVYY
jgi:hypothetical protein